MNSPEFWTLLAVTALGLPGLAWWIGRSVRRTLARDLPARVERAQAGMEERLSRTQTELLARVEQVRGDLRTDFAERLQTSLGALREGLDRQLAAGRSEQAQALNAAAAKLDRQFEALRAGTETRLDQFAQRQAESAREARVELARNLAAATETLRQRVEALEHRTAEHLDRIRTRVDEQLRTLNEQVQQKLEKNIQEGFAHFREVRRHLQAAEEQLRNVSVVGQSINELNALLKLPHLRGRFGEAELGRLLADFLPASAYAEQYAIVPGSREQVDAIVRFPKYVLPIDSKFNREQVLPLFEAAQPAQLAEARKQLAVAVRQQARQISEKYIHPEHGTTDLALMFLPSETLYFEVIRNPELCEHLHQLKVFPVSPNTLAITLRGIGMSISQYEFARNIESTLAQIRKARRNFDLFQKRFEDVGRGLERAQVAYQTATGHLHRYAQRVIRLTDEADALPAADADGREDGKPEISPPASDARDGEAAPA